MRLEPWNIVQMKQELNCALHACSNGFERGNCEAIARIEIRNKAREITKYRKLTPGEQSVLDAMNITL